MQERHKIAVIGVDESEDWQALSRRARRALFEADWVIGAQRHKQRITAFCGQQACQHYWEVPLSRSLSAIAEAYRGGKRVAVVATGDPLNFGIGVTLIREFGAENLAIHAMCGAFQLAQARLGWSAQSCTCLTLHGRPIESLRRHLQPMARLIILSHDASTVAVVAEELTLQGYEAAQMHVLCDMGSQQEKTHYFKTLSEVSNKDLSDLNTIAVELPPLQDCLGLPRISQFLRDDEFLHDGQITKEDVRAVTLMRLRPHAGAQLWDLGAGCGGISLAWILNGGFSLAVEKNPERCLLIQKNVANFGLSDKLNLHKSDIADFNFADYSSPDAIFWGGGIYSLELLETYYSYLKKNGIFVVNAVTLASQSMLMSAHAKYGGSLQRVNVERADNIGKQQSFKPARSVMQFWVHKT